MQTLSILIALSTGVFSLISAAGFASGLVRATRRAQHSTRTRHTQQLQLEHEAEVVRLKCELQSQNPVGIASGWRVVEVAEVVDESDDCRSFYLCDPNDKELPTFEPGQFLMVRPALGGADQPTRCYSLSDAPNPAWWRISVKRQEPQKASNGRTARSGLSVWLHRHARPGDCLLVKGPAGAFVIDRNHQGPIVLLAAGIGVTPMLSMLRWSLPTHPTRPVFFFFQAQDENRWPFGRQIHSWKEHYSCLQPTTYFSRQENIDRDVPGNVVSGKFGVAEILTRVGNIDDVKFYMCGTDRWMKAMREGLSSSGIAESAIHWESFGGPAAPRGSAPNAAAIGESEAPSELTKRGRLDAQAGNSPAGEAMAATAFNVRFALSEVEAASPAPDATVWQIAKQNGIELPSGCHSGVCGSCRIGLRAGRVRYETKPSYPLDEQSCLACVALPQSDIEVEG